MEKPLAARVLTSKGDAQSASLELFSPVFAAAEESANHDRGTWHSRFRMVLGGNVIAEGDGIGADSLEALIKSISSLRVAYKQSGLSSHFHMTRSGLPYYLPAEFGAEFDERIQKLIGDEASAFVKNQR